MAPAEPALGAERQMLTRESMSFTPTLLAGMVSAVICRERGDWR
jgi:hypothetical protein